jgi:hypothetical protein
VSSNQKVSVIHGPVFDDSVIVDTLLNDDNDAIIDTLDPGTLSKVTLGEITTLLAKTGHHQV